MLKKHQDLTKEIIGSFYVVYNALGYGFLEKIYENALAMELEGKGFQIQQQKAISVYYRQRLMGEYFADLVVNDLVIVELKAVRLLSDSHKAQLLNYLKATQYEVGLLLNFGPKPQRIRKVYDNNLKPNLNQ